MNENNEFDTTPKSEINATMAFIHSLAVILKTARRLQYFMILKKTHYGIT
jgi:hypothetical protein